MARTGQMFRARTARNESPSSTRSSHTDSPRTPRKAPLGDRLRYAFDNSMSRGTPALIAWLTVATIGLILVFAVFVAVLGLRGPDEGGEAGFFQEIFSGLLHALDPGTIGGDAGSWRFRLTMLALTIAGLFIVSALIGVIAAGIDTKISDLRRGRSIVLESDHTVILGWSDSIYTIISELSIANESRTRPVIVILAERDKVEMEDEVRAKVPDLRGTRVICRSGSPMDLDALALSRHSAARSVILLAPDSEDPDSEVIKTLLALTHGGTDGPTIVAEIRNPSNLEAARLVGAERTVLLDIRETVAKLIVQTSRQSGAAAVYVELFDYDGDEIYFLEDHQLADATYAEAQLAFENVTVIGVVDEGRARLNPGTALVVGDRTLIVVAQDDGGLAGADRTSVVADLSVVAGAVEEIPVPTSAVLVGWNERAPMIVRELDKYAPPGSVLTVLTVFDPPTLPALQNLAITVAQVPTTDRASLEAHIVDGLDQVIVLCYSEDLDVQTADARTLVTLLHVRDILSKMGSIAPVVSEMLDDRNRVLAQVAHIDDVVVSGEIVSLLVTQLSEDARLEQVFAQLLGQDGSEVHLKPAEWYVVPGSSVTYATIVASAAMRGETALGYSSPSLKDAESPFGVIVNPPKSQRFDSLAGDRVVVLADT